MRRNKIGILTTVFILALTMNSAAPTSQNSSASLWEGLNKDLIIGELQSSLALQPSELAEAVQFWEAKYRLHVPTWAPHYDVVTSLIRKHDCKYVCEVGVAFGTQSEHVLANTNVKLLYSIDPYIFYPNDGFPDGAKSEYWMDVLFHITSARLARYGIRSCLIRKKSSEAILLIADDTLDLVYIDGDHSYESVTHDLQAWYQKVMPGGLIVGDDYGHQFFPGLKKAVDYFVRTYHLNLTILPGNKFVIIKQ